MYDVMIIWYSDNVRMWEYDSIHMIIWSIGKKIDKQILETWLKNLRFWIEIWVPKPSKTIHLGSPGSQNSSWRHLGSAKGQPEALKRGLGEPNRSHRGCLETSLGSLGAAWGGSGTCLEDAQGSFWSKRWFQTRWFCCKLFWSCFFEVV